MVKQNKIDNLKKMYPAGTRVRLIHMNDKYAPPKGTTGTVWHVDDIGTIHVNWDNGQGLGLVIGEDEFEVL